MDGGAEGRLPRGALPAAPDTRARISSGDIAAARRAGDKAKEQSKIETLDYLRRMREVLDVPLHRTVRFAVTDGLRPRGCGVTTADATRRWR